MKAIQDYLLEECHKEFLDLCFSDLPLERAETIVSKKITGYGTNINEKIQSFYDFLSLLKLQREESIGIQFNFTFSPVSKTVFSNGNAAVFVDEMKLLMDIEENTLELNVRLSSVFEYDIGNWRAIHFHGSIPQGAEGDRDTWTVNEWKDKNEALEKIIEERTNELRESLEHLKTTQSQLIQSEKMASLGELTAGIAHEIQNPLNFVNNFAEVSNELIDEIQEEREKNKEERDEELVGDILEDIKQNLEKITHHGKRADGIVKGMLQHSRSSSGKKKPTNINTLADEYLRLAYHGLRAKDKSFNATMITDFDESIEIINVVPQDIGRVILNLITNAFYVVDEKKKSGLKNYEPTVTLTTKKNKDTVLISVKDNGNGIPQKVLDKIFQPFFTTKPTGQGTGLGLSVSYDIITKGHGGELKVETKQGKGTTFTITLPTN